MSRTHDTTVAVVGIDIGKNSFHIVGHDQRGAIVLKTLLPRAPNMAERRLVDYAPLLNLILAL